MSRGVGQLREEQQLGCSDSDVSTYFEGHFYDGFKIRGEEIPASIEIRAHRFRIIGDNSLFVGMTDAVEMIGEKFDEPILEEVIAKSGLKRHLTSLTPKLGNSILEQELNAYYLAPSEELERVNSPTHWTPLEEYKGTGPFVHMGTPYAQARISVYDFPAMVSYTMRNTALQHMINIASIGKPQDIDPRLALIDSLQPAATEGAR